MDRQKGIKYLVVLSELIERKKEIAEIDEMSPLIWAYIGDSVYELFIRMHLTNTTKLKPHKLHIASIQYVKAKAQAETLEKLMEHLTEKRHCARLYVFNSI